MELSYVAAQSGKGLPTAKVVAGPLRRKAWGTVRMAVILAAIGLAAILTIQWVSAGEVQSSSASATSSIEYDGESRVVDSYSSWQGNLLSWEDGVSEPTAVAGPSGSLSYLPVQAGGYHSYLS